MNDHERVNAEWQDWLNRFEANEELHDDTFDIGKMEGRATSEILGLFLPLLKANGRHVDPNDGHNVQLEEQRVRGILRTLIRGVGRAIMDQPFEVTDKALKTEKLANKLAWYYFLDRDEVFDVITGQDEEEEEKEDE